MQMQKLMDNQEILNSAMDKQNIVLKSVSKKGNKQFLQYYIDNNKLNQLLPIQIILNSIFDRQTGSICVNGNGNSGENADLSNYSGNINLTSANGWNIISYNENGVVLGNQNTTISINTSDVLLNGNGVNTPNGLVTLNNNGKINNDLISLQFDPKNLTIIQDENVLPSQNIQITVKTQNGTYKAITLQQLYELFSPKLQIYE